MIAFLKKVGSNRVAQSFAFANAIVFYFAVVWKHSYNLPETIGQNSLELPLLLVNFPSLFITAGISSLIFTPGSGYSPDMTITADHITQYWVELTIFYVVASLQWLFVGYGVSRLWKKLIR